MSLSGQILYELRFGEKLTVDELRERLRDRHGGSYVRRSVQGQCTRLWKEGKLVVLTGAFYQLAPRPKPPWRRKSGCCGYR